jgi:hypothetical protein
VILRILTRVAAGVALGGVIGNIVTGDWIYSIVWSVALCAVILLGLLSGLRGARTLNVGYALARVETVQRAGEGTAAAQPIVARLTVAPAATAPYATTLRADLPVDQLRALTPGAIIVVSRRSPVKPDVALEPHPPAEWAARAAAARLDPSLIPPASQVGDRIKPISRGPAFRAVSIVIIAVVAAATLVPAYGSIARNVENVAAGDWNGNNLVTGRYQQLAVDELVAVAGTTMCTDVSFYDSYVIAECLTRPGADTTDEYQWRYGRAFREGPALIQSTELEHELFDVSGLDFAQVAVSVKAGIAASGLTLTSGPYAWVARDFDGGGPVIHVSFGDDYRDASLDYSFDGEELSRSGSAFG